MNVFSPSGPIYGEPGVELFALIELLFSSGVVLPVDGGVVGICPLRPQSVLKPMKDGHVSSDPRVYRIPSPFTSSGLLS